jgi:hypothetical protein
MDTRTHPGGEHPLGAYAIGPVRGMAGSAGVGLLPLAQIKSRGIAVTALTVFALFTAVSMSIVSFGWGFALCRPFARRVFDRVTPALGLASLAFRAWHALGALLAVRVTVRRYVAFSGARLAVSVGVLSGSGLVAPEFRSAIRSVCALQGPSTSVGVRAEAAAADARCRTLRRC